MLNFPQTQTIQSSTTIFMYSPIILRQTKPNTADIIHFIMYSNSSCENRQVIH